MMKNQIPNQWEVLFWWFVHSHQLYANLLCCSFVLRASTLAFYLFKCKRFKADYVPSDKFPVNQDCLHFHLPLPTLRKLTRKCFIVKQRKKKHFLTQRKCSVMFRKTNCSYVAIFILKLHIHVGLRL